MTTKKHPRAGAPRRVHGILIDEVFYVIWLDPDHRLYA